MNVNGSVPGTLASAVPCKFGRTVVNLPGDRTSSCGICRASANYSASRPRAAAERSARVRDDFFGSVFGERSCRRILPVRTRTGEIARWIATRWALRSVSRSLEPTTASGASTTRWRAGAGCRRTRPSAARSPTWCRNSIGPLDAIASTHVGRPARDPSLLYIGEGPISVRPPIICRRPNYQLGAKSCVRT
jgi:hypothetical protein